LCFNVGTGKDRELSISGETFSSGMNLNERDSSEDPAMEPIPSSPITPSRISRKYDYILFRFSTFFFTELQI